MYKIAVEQLPVTCPEIFRWCLDFPLSNGEVSLAELETDGVLFQGWVLPRGTAAMPIPYIRVQEEAHSLDLNCRRPDVIARVLEQDAAAHPLLQCGFRHHLPLTARDVVFGFRVQEGEDGCVEYDCVRLRVEGTIKVLEGQEGWLFLDNDTNQSVEQFKGELLLDRSGRKAWSSYLDEFTKAACQSHARHAVLIAPAKEMVLAQFYPFTKGRTSPVEQVLRLASRKHRLVYPVETLKASEERVFRITDTHWALHGAMLAVVEVLSALGIDPEPVREVFAHDQYRQQEVAGDLGSKFYPRRVSAEKSLSSCSYQKQMIYDNHLPNFGRVILFANDDALLKGKCLIFGSSSIYSTLAFFSRIFSDLVLVHSAGNVDLEVLRYEAPDYVIAQTNGRFVIRPPVVGYSLSAAMAEKMAVLSDKERSEVLYKSQQWLLKKEGEQLGYYQRMLLSAAEQE
jgi:alginate O-acetyltransferase complex protein AlgJ